MIGLSSLLYADFSRSTAGVVTDSVTHLEWQDDYSDNDNTIKAANWTEAIAYCEGLGLDGTGWRLPNKKELLSIVDYSVYGPSISSVFEKISYDHYWSSTTQANYTPAAWGVYFYTGQPQSYFKTNSINVRCVRDRPRVD